MANSRTDEEENPFFEELFKIKTKKAPVYNVAFESDENGRYEDRETGELVGIKRERTGIFEWKDEDGFVKIYSEPIYSSVTLGSAARKVFDAILEEYGKTPMSRGYVDRFYLKWYNNGVNGGNTKKTRISRNTFSRGRKELVEKRFIEESKRPDIWWANPLVFFKGNRAKYLNDLKERRKKGESNEDA